MTAAELLAELDQEALRAWAKRTPIDDIKLGEFDQLVHDLLAAIDCIRLQAAALEKIKATADSRINGKSGFVGFAQISRHAAEALKAAA